MKVNLTSIVKKTALISVLSLVWGATYAAQSVEQRLERLEQMADSRGQLQADIMFQLNSLQQELQQLRGKVEEHEYQLKQLQDRQRDLYRDIERRLSQLQGGQSAQNTDRPVSTNSSTTNSGVSASSSASEDVHSAYNNIFAKVRAKKYQEAISDYQAFLKTYPNSQYQASVHYWLGQIYYIQQNFEQALKEYQMVTQNHADSTRAPDSLFKQGKVLLLLNKTSEAKAIFNQVIEKYDGTSEQLAKTELQKLK